MTDAERLRSIECHPSSYVHSFSTGSHSRSTVRWDVLVAYVMCFALSYFASLAFQAEHWMAFGVLVLAVTAVGCFVHAERSQVRIGRPRKRA